MVNLTELDQLLSRLSTRVSESANATAALQDELVQARKQVEEKELDKIRALKEKDRQIEELERDKMNLQKEKEVLEAKIEEVAKTLRTILPDSNVGA